MIRKNSGCWLAAFVLLLFATSCHHYYKAEMLPAKDGTEGRVDSLRALNRYFILRTGGEAFFMKNMVFSEDRKTMTVTLDSLPPDHRLHLVNGLGGDRRYRPSQTDDLGVLSEVHFYTTSVKVAVGETITLPLNQVQKIEVLEKDKKRTTNSYVIGAVGTTLGAMAVAFIIALATKSSCPFVSAYDGERFGLQGEIYGGAIYPQMARHDYLPLKMAPLADGTLQLKISNELKEKQFTDFANLLVIRHAPGTRILADESGRLYSVGSPQSPVAATLSNGKDALPALRQAGDMAVLYLDDTTSADAVTTIHLRFHQQTGAATAKLVLTLKNSYWLDNLYGELAKGFGRYYGTYMKKQAKKPARQLVQWTKDQHMPLSVSLQTAQGWQKLADLTTIGPLANRTVVVPIPLDRATPEVEIKLSAGFLFWEIDYAGLDFSADDAYQVETLQPLKATDERGNDVLPLLQQEDGLHLEQPEIGNVATLVYKTAQPLAANETYTCILHTKGWYQHLRQFTNKPDVGFLKQFTRPAAFPQFGKRLYQKVEQENIRLMARNQ